MISNARLSETFGCCSVQYSGSVVYILPCTVAFQMFMNEIKAETFKFIAAIIKNTSEK